MFVYCEYRNSIVGVLISIRSAHPRSRSTVVVKTKRCFLLQIVHTGAGANRPSHLVSKGSFSPRPIWPESEAELLLYSAPTLRISGGVHQISICLNFFYENNPAFFMYCGH